MSRRRTSIVVIALMLVPTLVLLALFNYYPAVLGLLRAFTRWETGEDPQWIGVGNFVAMWHDEFLRLSLRNLLILLIANVLKMLTMPLLVAELLVGLRSPRWQYVLRTAFVLPMVVPGMVTMLLWVFIYDGSIGLLNHVLEAVGMGALARSWLGESGTALWAIVGIGFPWEGWLCSSTSRG